MGAIVVEFQMFYTRETARSGTGNHEQLNAGPGGGCVVWSGWETPPAGGLPRPSPTTETAPSIFVSVRTDTDPLFSASYRNFK